MDEMMFDRKNVKAKLEAALNEPSAPEALVNRTIARVRAIEAGRNALHALEEKGTSLPRSEVEELAARCVVGQLLTDNAPRANVKGEELAEQLRSVASFRKLVELPTAELVKKLADGRTAGSLAKALPGHAEKKQQAPVIEAPVKTRPGRTLG